MNFSITIIIMNRLKIDFDLVYLLLYALVPARVLDLGVILLLYHHWVVEGGVVGGMLEDEAGDASIGGAGANVVGRAVEGVGVVSLTGMAFPYLRFQKVQLGFFLATCLAP